MSQPTVSYDNLSDDEQQQTRAELAARIEAARAELNLAEEFAALGRPYVELDSAGSVVRRVPSVGKTAIGETIKRLAVLTYGQEIRWRHRRERQATLYVGR